MTSGSTALTLTMPPIDVVIVTEKVVSPCPVTAAARTSAGRAGMATGISAAGRKSGRPAGVGSGVVVGAGRPAEVADGVGLGAGRLESAAQAGRRITTAAPAAATVERSRRNTASAHEP